jgi:mono/diheme cytochrome c family protein
LLAACDQKMADQPSYRPNTASDFFADGSAARPIPADTVARGQATNDSPFFTGQSQGTDVTDFPIPVTAETMQRGESRFRIFCAPCHGEAGYGDGVIVQRGFTPPPSFHTDALRAAPVGHYFQVATNGFGAMPSYAAQLAPADRWAVVAYIRALQLSQHASLDDVPADQRADLEGQP